VRVRKLLCRKEGGRILDGERRGICRGEAVADASGAFD
jgi:hypothetical protein